MKQKLLLVSVASGSGHVRAAEALLQTAKLSYPQFEVVHVDMMDYVAPPLRRAFLDTYDMLIRQVPGLWRYMYRKTNDEKTAERLKQLTSRVNRFNTPQFFEAVNTFRPDHIICTHFLPAQYCSQMKKMGKLTANVSFVLTDYDRHELMSAPGIDQYFVSTEKMKWKMIHSGISTDKIIISGIPIDPVWYTFLDKQVLRRRHNISLNARVYTIVSGGGGSGRLDEVIESLYSLVEPTTLIVIAGKNTVLKTRLDALTPPEHLTLKIVGWTDVVHEYIGLADAIVTKPGGLTSTECMVAGQPIIAVTPIPGQEEENMEYLLGEGCGVSARTTQDLLYYLSTPPNQLPRKNTIRTTQVRAADIILETLRFSK